MTKKILLIVGLCLLLIPNIASAQGLFQNWYEYLNIPRDYSRFPNLLYFVIIPFIGTFAIIWGILTGLPIPIFRARKVNIILSFVFAFSLLYTGALLAVVSYLFQIGSIFGVVAFFILFIGLTALYTYHRTGEEYLKARKVHEKYKDITKGREDLLKKMSDITDKIRKKQDEKAKLSDERNDVRNFLIDLETSYPPTLAFPVGWETIKRRIVEITHKSPSDLIEGKRFLNQHIGKLEQKLESLSKELENLDKEMKTISEKYKKSLEELK